MVSHLYWISDLVYVIVLAIFRVYFATKQSSNKDIRRAYMLLLDWVLIFCVLDGCWGIIALNHGQPIDLFFIDSTLIHIFYTGTTYIYLNFLLKFVRADLKVAMIFKKIVQFFVLLQIVLVLINTSIPIIFLIDETGTYIPLQLRNLAFVLQYSVFIFTGLVSLVLAYRNQGETRKKFLALFSTVLFPIIFGIFQLTYIDGPFYSIGYFIGCIVISLYVMFEEHEDQVIFNSNIDELTGLYNRNIFEADLNNDVFDFHNPKFVFISMDVNDLKPTNDNLGHSAGDELLKGAATAIKSAFSSYGRVYRTGGDEFIAMIYADSEKLNEVLKDFQNLITNFKGEYIEHLSVACGYVTRSEYPNVPLSELVEIADERMYKDKSEYYVAHGLNKQGLQDAYNVICSSYCKILRVNLTFDSYVVIEMNNDDLSNNETQKPTISSWFKEFGNSKYVSEDDQELFIQKTDLNYLREYFKSSHDAYYFHYKRLVNGEYKQHMMELAKSREYTDFNQIVYLYVKNVDNIK